MSADRYTISERLRILAEAGDLRTLVQELTDLHPSDIADLLESLSSEERRVAVLDTLTAEMASEALTEMADDEERAELLSALDDDRGVELIHEMADDDAADLVGDLGPADRDRILAALPVDEAGEIRELLRYDDETAGGLMTTALVSVVCEATAAEAIDEIRRMGREAEDFYTVFVVDVRDRLRGTVGLNDLILADPTCVIESLIEPSVATVQPDEDQEEVGRLMSRYNLVSVPVVNEDGALLGRITFDDVIDVIEAETTEDILKLAGVPDEEELRAGWTDAVRSRLPWLMLNLITASAAASVILFHEGTIRSLPFLAFLMPVIAALAGNSGTQALAVTIRRIALADQFSPSHYTAVRKEVLVGMLNGLVLGGLFGVFGFFMEGLNVGMGLVVLGAMWANIIVAGFAGALVPTVLDRLGADPAVASSVFVHTLTDLVGFFVVLSLAGTLLL